MSFGAVRVGGLEVAIKSSVLQEVVCPPDCFVRQVLAPEYVIGLFNLRGCLIPTADLRFLLRTDAPLHSDGTAADQPIGKIVILKTPLGMLGLAIDDIVDLIAGSDANIQQLRSPRGERSLVSSLLLVPETNRIIHILDIDAVLSQPGINAVALDAQGRLSDRTNRIYRPFLFFECDEMRFCLEATALHEIVDQPVLEGDQLRLDVYKGIAWRHGRAVPVLDLFGLLALPKKDLSAPKLLVMDVRGQRIGLLISEVLSITRRDAGDILPFAEYGLVRPEFFGGVLPGQHGGKDAVVLSQDAVLLEHEAILRDDRVRSLHRLHDGLAAGESMVDDGAVVAVRTSFLAFQVGIPYKARWLRS